MNQNINLNLYKTFVALYETKNMRKAAEKIGVSQPAVFSNTRELEKQLDVKLFISNNRGVEPTEEANILHKDAKNALTLLDSGVRAIKLNSDVIRIAFATNFAAHILAEFVCEFNELNKSIKFHMNSTRPTEAINMLRERKVDLVFNTLPTEGLEFEQASLMQLKQTFFTSQEYAKQNDVQPIISKEKFDTLSNITLIPQEAMRNSKYTVETQDMLYKFIMNNKGVGYCIEQFLDRKYPDASILKFKVDGIELRDLFLSCIYNKSHLSQPAKKFLNSIKSSQHK